TLTLPLISSSIHPQLLNSALFSYTTLFRSYNSSDIFLYTVPSSIIMFCNINIQGFGDAGHTFLVLQHQHKPVDNVIVSRVRLVRSEEHTSELQSRFDLVCRLLLEKKKTNHT